MADRRERLLELGSRLRRLRQNAGLTGVDLAARAGIAQATVSKIETGRMLPSADTVERLAGALKLGAATRRELSAMRERVRGDLASLRGGLAGREALLASRVRDARVVRSFQSAIVPDLLQTAEYARHVLSTARAIDEEDLARAVAARVDRQSVLYEADREFVFVVTEAALRTWPGSGELMPAQLHRLASLGTLQNVSVGVLPWEVELPGFPLHGFTIYDDAAVFVETFATDLMITASAELAHYVEVFTAFQRLAVTGTEAGPVLDRIEAFFRDRAKN